MFGPLPGPWRRISFALTMASVTFVVGLAPGVARAEDGPEAVIGTFESTNAPRAAQGKPATFDFAVPSASSQPRVPAQQKAPVQAEPKAIIGAETRSEDEGVSRLYADALDDLENGRSSSAERKFEQVVARDPDGHLAKTARGYLAELYRGPAPATQQVSTAPHAPVAQPKFATPRSSLGAGTLAKSGQDQPAVARPATESLGIAVSAGVEEEFIVTAGDRVFFAAGSADLGQRARIVLSAQARWLASHPDLKAVIEGHADDGALPSEQTTQLSEARALAVRDRLMEEGIAASRLNISGLGRRQPVADCPGPDCAAQNRRAVTVLKTNARDIGRQGRGPAVASEGVRTPMP